MLPALSQTVMKNRVKTESLKESTKSIILMKECEGHQGKVKESPKSLKFIHWELEYQNQITQQSIK